MTRILIVDDEPHILRVLRLNLRARRFEVDIAATGTDALAAAARRTPDAVVLDLGLPDMDGIDVITGLRAWTTVPIVIVSGRTDPADKTAAIDAGADDYLTKPFTIDDLLTRIGAALRRGHDTGQLAAG